MAYYHREAAQRLVDQRQTYHQALTLRPLILEFVGLPGAGKSSLSPVVARYLAAARLPVSVPVLKQLPKGFLFERSPLRTLLHAERLVRIILVQPELVSFFVHLFLSRRSRSGITGDPGYIPSVRMLGRQLYMHGNRSLRRMACLRSGGIQVLDEGAFMTTYAMCHYAQTWRFDELVRRVRKIVTVPHVVVFVAADTHVLERRICVRSTNGPILNHLRTAPGSSLAVLLKSRAASIALLREAVQVVAGERTDLLAVDVVNNDDMTLDAIAQNVAEQITPFWGRLFHDEYP